MDLTESIAPKSDQLNADDLIAGPVTVTITEVKKGTAEQPVDVVLDEFGTGRPLKPSKSMRRVMVAAWGADASVYVGRRLTIYREPSIKFGGQEVGGIRISHLSHIDKPFTVALTVAKGKRQPFKVGKLPNVPTQAQPADDGPTPQMVAQMVAGLADIGYTEKGPILEYVSKVLDVDVISSKDLTADQVRRVLAEVGAAREPWDGGKA